jgi:hypothetical protein
MFHGYGICCDKNGNVYEGDWVENERNGVAHYRTNDGDLYIGEFKNDQLNGEVI